MKDNPDGRWSGPGNRVREELDCLHYWTGFCATDSRYFHNSLASSSLSTMGVLLAAPEKYIFSVVESCQTWHSQWVTLSKFNARLPTLTKCKAPSCFSGAG